MHGATPCTTLGVPEFSQGRAYGDSLGPILGSRADRMRVLLPISSPRGRERGELPIDSSALKLPGHLPVAPKLARKFAKIAI